MAKKQVPKKAKRRLLLFGPIAVILIIYCAYTLVTTMTSLYKLHKEEKELNTKLDKLKYNATDLKTEITKLQDKDYIARYARENYLYTKDGEYVIKVDKQAKKVQEKKTSDNEKYIIYGCSAGAAFIIIFIIVKHHKSKKKKRY